jgi:hypothetical protein
MSAKTYVLKNQPDKNGRKLLRLTKVKIIYRGGKHGRNLENPPHSPMEESSATFS